ncbi:MULTISPECIES: hypothetical protein [unclassified Rhizobium]|uniref:hypothetical protein n=1 Tax=unclassified Rhizobium TaxID=2613769 RepID=UPI00288B67D5|nr:MULTISPECIES: hypothetical protein [unclassified Rhizobium]
MTKIHKKRVLTLLAIVLAAAALLPVLFGATPEISVRKGEDNWRNFVYDFQTLITGVLAIGAAFFTIRSGQEIDERQQIRHDQTLELQSRPDKLKIARAKTLFQSVAGHRVVIKDGTLPDTQSPGDLDQNSVMRVGVLRWSSISLMSALTSDHFKAIENLFDGHLQTQYGSLKERLSKYSENVLILAAKNGDVFTFDVLPGVKENYVMSDRNREMVREDLVRRHPAVRAHLEAFEQGFDKLAKLYKVD